MGQSSVAAATRRRKEQKPELYCPQKDCLWMTGDGRACPNHGGPTWTRRWQELARQISRGDITVWEAHQKETEKGIRGLHSSSFRQ